MFSGKSIDELMAIVEEARESAGLPVVISEAQSVQIVGDLIYSNYRQQRLQFPDIQPERWARIYDNWEYLEARYQQEREEYYSDTKKHLDNWIVERGASA